MSFQTVKMCSGISNAILTQLLPACSLHSPLIHFSVVLVYNRDTLNSSHSLFVYEYIIFNVFFPFLAFSKLWEKLGKNWGQFLNLYFIKTLWTCLPDSWDIYMIPVIKHLNGFVMLSIIFLISDWVVKSGSRPLVAQGVSRMNIFLFQACQHCMIYFFPPIYGMSYKIYSLLPVASLRTCQSNKLPLGVLLI